MKKILLTAGVLLQGLSAHAQLTYVGDTGFVTVTPNTLVYNGGGLKVDTGGVFNNGGNLMLVGSGADAFETTTTGSFTLIDNAPGNFTAPSYGQLYISGISQANLTGIVNKQYQVKSNGDYQQMGLPFYNKIMKTFNDDFRKTFGTTLGTKKEILNWQNERVMGRLVKSLASTTNPFSYGPSSYYMLGANELDVSARQYTLKGMPYADGIQTTLTNAGFGIDFDGSTGVGGGASNVQYERYNSYLRDYFYPGAAWTGDYGRNIYQYGNPHLTNLDLGTIYNSIPNIQGMKFGGVYTYSSSTGTSVTDVKYVTFSTSTPAVPVGDTSSLLIKPLETFVIKLRDNNTASTLPFNGLRTFSSALGTPITSKNVAARSVSGPASTVKELAVLALDQGGKELGRTYFVIYSNGISGRPTVGTTQVKGAQKNIIGTFEEDSISGGADASCSGEYWLYINEANEQNFRGKALQMSIFGSNVKSLKFQIKENGVLVDSGVHNFSTTGTGFYYQAKNGNLEEIAQDGVVPVSADQYSLFYDKPSVLSTKTNPDKISRTQVAFNPAIDNYIIKFDSDWKKADIQVYDMSGKLVINKQNVSTSSDFVIELNKHNQAYIVTAVSDKGVKATTKIIR